MPSTLSSCRRLSRSSAVSSGGAVRSRVASLCASWSSPARSLGSTTRWPCVCRRAITSSLSAARTTAGSVNSRPSRAPYTRMRFKVAKSKGLSTHSFQGWAKKRSSTWVKVLHSFVLPSTVNSTKPSGCRTTKPTSCHACQKDSAKAGQPLVCFHRSSGMVQSQSSPNASVTSCSVR